MPRVVHFELPAEDPERASTFYRNVFGWTIHKWDGPQEYWLVTTGAKEAPGIDGGLMRASAEFPARTPINTIDVPAIDEYIAKVEAAGGKVIMPKTAIPGVGQFAYCADTEGVIFGMMQFERPGATA
jgi:predicted enzyme related to lactoylglutathione lyase